MIVFGAMEAALTPLMEAIERAFPGVKVFSLPSVDHPDWGRHIELGVKGDASLLDGGLCNAARRSARPRAPNSAPNWCDDAAHRCASAVRRSAPRAAPRPGSRHWHAFC